MSFFVKMGMLISQISHDSLNKLRKQCVLSLPEKNIEWIMGLFFLQEISVISPRLLKDLAGREN